MANVELGPEAVRIFQNLVYQHFREHGRSFAWRRTHDPYCILVSEIMLQQTRTDRVTAKYEQFIRTFPDFAALAGATLQKILSVWQGLGYNRRALALKKIAYHVVTAFDGHLPSDPEILDDLPGIGKTTACAISTFAFNTPTVFIETNLRTVFIHHFFSGRSDITDTEILPIIEMTLDRSNPRTWYYALMDYGVMLKKTFQNPGRKSAHFTKQSPFEGSDRQIRGAILKILIAHPNISEYDLISILGKEPRRVTSIIEQLYQEGFIEKADGRLIIDGKTGNLDEQNPLSAYKSSTKTVLR
jgi:A/G-specific adenine glycosylase